MRVQLANVFVVLSIGCAFPLAAQRTIALPPFGGTITRLPVAEATHAFFQPETIEVTAAATPAFDLYTKDSVGYDHGAISPTLVLGYNKSPTGAHPWAIEMGYKYGDANPGHTDVALANAWAVLWGHGTDLKNESVTFETDFTDAITVQKRLDAYFIGEVVRFPFKVDLLAGATGSKATRASSTSDVTFGVLPTAQLGKSAFSVTGLYSLKNSVDGEDYYEAGVARSFEKPSFQLALVAAKHGTYALRFQKTLKRFYRRSF